MKVSYKWLQGYTPQLPQASRLEDIFNNHLCEVESVEQVSVGGEEDTIFDLGILPNRAHDLLSHQGIAKELSGLLGISFQDPSVMYKVPDSQPTQLAIHIESSACRRYMGRIVRGIKVGPSPDWVVKYLESIGEKSINNIVDATNIIMYDSGNPCHAFDLRNAGSSIFIKNATEGEELELLGSEKKIAVLKDTDLVIADSTGKTLALAGVKGGTNSGIENDTADIILEVANFDPVSVRKTARRIGVLSDAAKRFENDLSPEHAAYAMRELSALIAEMCPGASFEDVVDVYPNPQTLQDVSFETSFVNRKLGIEISSEEIETILNNYGFVYKKDGEVFTVTPPALRLDLEIPEDFVEEIGRIVGYDRVIPIMPNFLNVHPHSVDFMNAQDARRYLLSQGFNEVKTYAFRKKGDFEVVRGVGDKSALRKNISDGLKESFELNKLNAQFLGLDDIKIFEIGSVFPKTGEVVHVATADKKGVSEMPLSEFIEKNKEAIEILSGDVQSTSDAELFTMWSIHPYITRDVAVWVSDRDDQQTIENIVRAEGGELLVRDPYLVDVFEKDRKISFAYRLIFQAFDRTLSDKEIEPIMEKIYQKLSEQEGFEIR